MKKITLWLFLLIFPLLGYAQVEGFEEATFPPTTPANWAVLDNGVGTAQSWMVTTDPTRVHSGLQAAIIDRENIGAGNTSQDWLITNRMTLPANGQLRFWTRQTVVGNQGSTYEIRVSTNATQSNLAAFTSVQTWTELNLNTTYNVYEEKTVQLAYPAGTQVYIAFVKVNTQVGTGISGDRWLVDDVQVVQQCLDPSGLNVTNLASVTASLNWTNNGSATQWEVEVLPAASTPGGSGTVVGATTYNATGLTPGTNYKFLVRALCSPGNVSNWVQFNFTTKPAGSICATPIIIGSSTYSDTSNTNLYGDEVDIPQGPGCAGGATNYLQGFEVFYSFTPTVSENISITMTPSGPNSSIFVYNGCANVGVSCLAGVAATTSTPRVIPTLAVVAGQTYVIVISTNTTTQSTGYSLVLQPVTCTPPSGLPTTNIGTSTASLSWTNPTGATAWQVAVQTAGSPIPTAPGLAAGTNTNFGVSGLTAGTAYQYWVRSDCGGGIMSPWAGPYLFNTRICEVADQCTYTFRLTSTSGQWAGARMEVRQNGVVVATLGAQFTTGTTVDVPVTLCQNYPFELFWTLGGTAPTRVGVSIINNFAQTLYTKPPGTGTSNSSLYTTGFNCSVAACLDPTALTVTAITTTTANLGWTPNGSTLWDIYLVPNGSPAPTAATVPTYAGVNTNPFGVSGLTQLTTYQFYVRAVCSPTNNSNWSVPRAFTTLPTCPSPTTLTTTAITASSVTVGWTNVGPATAWEIKALPCGSPAPTPASTGWTPAPTNPFVVTGLSAGTCYDFYVRAVCSPTDTSPVSVPKSATTQPGCGSLFVDSGGSANVYSNNEDITWTICPTNPGDLVTVTFSSFNTETNWDGLYVFDGNSVASPQISSGNPANNVPGGLAGPFYGTTIPGPFEATSASGCLTFRFRSDSSGTFAGWVANVTCNPPPTCAKPITLGANTITQATANLTWVQPATPGTATAWEIVVQPSILGAPTGSGTPTGSNPYPAIGLTPGTSYEFYVRANCGATDGLSAWAGPFNFGTVIANDECINAVNVPVNSDATCALTTSGSIVGATGSLPATACAGTANDDVWFKFTATAPKHYINFLNVAGSTTDLNHVVYSGTCGSLVQFGPCLPNNNSIIAGLTVGNVYYIRVYTATATTNQTTTFDLCIGTVSTCSTAEATCSDPTDPFIFPNTTGVPSEAAIACVATNPNPTYYFMTILQSGNLAFQITQNTSFNAAGNPTGLGLDVDFVAWGPFPSNAAGCGALGIGCPTPGACPNNTTNPTFYPYGNIMDCSYSINPVETFNIANAVAGQVYVILITNFNGAPGFIRFDQTNFGVPGSGLTDCSIVCEVDLGPDQNLCGASSVILDSQLANPLATFKWYRNGIEIIGATSQTYTATQSGTYSVTGTCGPNSVGYPSDPDATMILNLGPNVVIGDQPDYVLCDDASNDGIATFDLATLTPNVLAGLDTNFTYNVNYYYNEADALAGNTNTINPAIPYPGTTQTIYITVSAVGSPQCNTVVAQNLVVKTSPVATLTSSDADNTICSNDTATITVTPTNFPVANATYTWTLNGLTLPDTGNVIVPIASGTYEVTVDLNGCTTVLSLVFTINPVPVATLASDDIDNTICSDQTALITATPTNFLVGDATYAWTLNGVPLPDTDNDVVPTASGTYEVTITLNGCSNVYSLLFTINPLPVATIDSSDADDTICSNDTATITVTPTNFLVGDATYSWTLNGNPLPDTDHDVVPTVTGTYEVTVNLNGCSITLPLLFTVNPVPVGTLASTDADNTICSNVSATITLTPTNFLVGDATYSWTLNGNPLPDTDNDVVPTATGTYEVTITLNGCTQTYSLLFTINPQPVATIDSSDADDTICSNDTATITVTPTNFVATAATYAWTLNGTPLSDTDNTVVPTATGTYQVVINLNGCSTTLSLPFTINTLPAFSIDGTNLIKCAAETAVLTVVPSNFLLTDPVTYTWTHDGNPMAETTSSIEVTAFGTYEVTVNNNGCSTTHQIEVGLDVTQIEINTTGECFGTNYIITATPVSGSFDPSTVNYEWTNSSGTVVGSNQNTFNVTEYVAANGSVSFPATFNVKITTTPEGCIDSQEYVVVSSACTIQKGISPNGDGDNDYFDLKGLGVKHLGIFNRYGTKVFSFDNYRDEWHGQTDDGKDLPVGTYYFVIDQNSGETKTGWIYINK